MALQPPSMAKSQSRAGSKYSGSVRTTPRPSARCLVDGEDRDVAGPVESTVIMQGAQVSKDGRRSIREGEHVAQVVRSREGQQLLGERGGLVIKQR